MAATHQKAAKGLPRWCKLALGAGVAIAALIAMAVLNLDRIARVAVNRMLSNEFPAGTSLANIEIELIQGRIRLSGLTVQSPPGAKGRPLMVLDHLMVSVDLGSLLDDEIVIQELVIRGVSVRYTVSPEGHSNWGQLGAMRKSPDSRSTESVEALPSVRIERARLEDGTLEYKMAAQNGVPVVFVIEDVQINAEGLRLYGEREAGEPATVFIACQVRQPGNLPRAHWGAVAVMGPLGRGVPQMNMQTRLTGLKLVTLGPLVPEAAHRALRAEGMDLGLALALTRDDISLHAVVLSDQDMTYDALKIQGPLGSPAVEIAPVLAGVFGHVANRVLNLGKDGVQTGVEAVKGGSAVIKDVGTGTVRVGTNVGHSLFKIGTGLVTLNRHKVANGISGSTRGTVDLTVGIVRDSVGAAGKGAKSSLSHMTGGEGIKAWDAAIPTRYQAAMQQAQNALSGMPYPPVTQ